MIKKMFSQFVKSRCGLATIEYGLGLSLIGVAIITGSTNAGNSISTYLFCMSGNHANAICQKPTATNNESGDGGEQVIANNGEYTNDKEKNNNRYKEKNDNLNKDREKNNNRYKTKKDSKLDI